MQSVKKIGRRAWLARAGAGLVALWTEFGRTGHDGTGFLLGTARAVEAAQLPAPRILDAHIAPELPGLGVVDVRAFAVVRGRDVALVDTLLPGNVSALADLLRDAGAGFDAVKHVILTHWHADHAGSAAELAEVTPGAAWYAGAPDIAQLMSGVPEFKVPPLRRPVKALADGDEVFGLRVVATPGHTPGHISLLDPVGSALLIGDAAVNLRGVLVGSPPRFSADLVQAGQSIHKLAGLGFEKAIFSHGPAITSGGAAALGRLLERYPRASDGQSLEYQSAATQAAFWAIHGEHDGRAWVAQHEAELAAGVHVQVEVSSYAC
jgi:glyoxylase-like metal-dependent hydrolase (beta-lactamase superfamily II)